MAKRNNKYKIDMKLSYDKLFKPTKSPLKQYDVKNIENEIH